LFFFCFGSALLASANFLSPKSFSGILLGL